MLFLVDGMNLSIIRFLLIFEKTEMIWLIVFIFETSEAQSNYSLCLDFIVIFKWCIHYIDYKDGIFYENSFK